LTRTHDTAEGPSIWWWAFGYFAAYAPYSALTKALSSGMLGEQLDGFVVLPLAVLASTIGMAVFLVATGWWRAASRVLIGGFAVPTPTRLTLLSGTCTAAILVSTTLAYTFEGLSIVFAMLLMRGGVLAIAPIVDVLGGRAMQTRSKVALVLTLLALFAAWLPKRGFDLTLPAAIDIGVYLAAYFVRLRLMSGQAKSTRLADNRRFFVEEQLVASPLSLLVLGLWALFGVGAQSADIARGFTGLWDAVTPAGLPVVVVLFAIGVLSQGTGIFGGLILLDKRENTFCVPVNRASSVLAGVVATLALFALGAGRAPPAAELVGALLIIAAIVVLSLPARAAPPAR
jgi:hypothetical protein